jgi:hypothetical protein
LRLTFRVNLDQGFLIAHPEHYEPLPLSNGKSIRRF